MEATKQAYLDNMGKVVKVGRYTCEVCQQEKQGRSGTWERGFKFTSSTYGYLKTTTKARGVEFSFDHGATWHWCRLNAAKVRSGKILLERNAPRKEFAYDSIQRINAAYGL